MAKRKSKNKAKGYLLPKYQTGTEIDPRDIKVDQYGNSFNVRDIATNFHSNGNVSSYNIPQSSYRNTGFFSSEEKQAIFADNPNRIFVDDPDKRKGTQAYEDLSNLSNPDYAKGDKQGLPLHVRLEKGPMAPYNYQNGGLHQYGGNIENDGFSLSPYTRPYKEGQSLYLNLKNKFQNGEEVTSTLLGPKPLAYPNGPMSAEAAQQEFERRKKAEDIYNLIKPSGYNSLDNYFNALRIGKDKNVTPRTDFVDPRSEEAFKQYLGINTSPKYFGISPNKPSIAKNPDAVYYKLDDKLERQLLKFAKTQDIPLNEMVEFNEGDLPWDWANMHESGYDEYSALGTFQIGRGIDPETKEEYYSYYDKYDFPEHIQSGVEGVTEGLGGSPFEVYNRLPKNPKRTFEEEEYQKALEEDIRQQELELKDLDEFQEGGEIKEDYNMQRALELGYTPDETGHMPSVDHETGMWLKSKEHPTAYKEFISMMLNPDIKAVVNPEGYFEENQLQYIPRKENGGEVLPEELPHQEIVSFPTEREPAGDPRVPRSSSVQDYYTNLENTPVPKTISKKYKIWEDTYKSPMGLPIKSYKNIYDIQAFFNSGNWKEDFKNIENYRKSSHPMLGSVDPKTNTFIPSEENLNTNEEIASHIDINAIPVNFKKVERIPINPDGFAPGSATEFADKVVIPSGNITMKDMQEPILANGEMLMPGDEAQFDTDYVVEEKLPKAQDGLKVEGKKLSKKEVDDVRNFVEDDTNFVQEYPYLLDEVVVEDKLDRTNPTAVRNWSREHDPIAYAAREATDEAAPYVATGLGMAFAPAAGSLLGAGARGLAATGEAAYGALSPYASAAWNTSVPGMASIPGATIGNIINAGFGTHGATNIAPDALELLTNPLSLENLANVGIDALEMAPMYGPMSKMLGELETIGRVSKSSNPTNAATIEGVLPTIKQPIPSKPAPWSLQEIPGLHLKSTMEGEAISKIIDKTGKINTEQALGIIGKESGGADKVALIKQGLGDNIPKKMDYNEFRKVVQDQLIPLERQFSTQASNYGVGKLGYSTWLENEYGNLVRSYSHDGPLLPSHFQKMLDNIDNPANYYKGYKNRYYISDVNTDGFNTIDEAKTFIKDITNKSIKQRLAKPLENQTLILGNKNKFGRGSSAHNNPEETLGHVHFLRDAETPDVLTVTQIQSDAFQGTNRTMPKVFDKEYQLRSLKGMEKLAAEQEAAWKNAVQQPDGSWKYPGQETLVSDYLHKKGPGAQREMNAIKKAEIENFFQKQLLDKNHQERYLQELVNYAGERGDVSKLRLPTSETAAKVQGYSKVATDRPVGHEGFWDVNTSGNYSPEHQTILKKYSEQPKTIKKLFGQDAKIVTDSKGNTWYEFDIPKKFKEGKGEIKAFEYGGKL